MKFGVRLGIQDGVVRRRIGRVENTVEEYLPVPAMEAADRRPRADCGSVCLVEDVGKHGRNVDMDLRAPVVAALACSIALLALGGNFLEVVEMQNIGWRSSRRCNRLPTGWRGEGVLFRSPEALQRAHNVGVIVFDKTGTLSRGIFSLERTEILAHGVDKIILPLTSTNEHPISKAVHAFVRTPVQELTSLGLTLFTVTIAGELIAAFGLSDTPRPDAPALLAELAARGKRVFLLSGDNPGAVARFAATLQLPAADVEAACAPADKAAFVKALQERGHRVCFVGDGTNDAPALAQADVAFCVATGADVAVAAAGALVAGENLQRGVLGALDVATHAHQHLLLALGWCVMYNVAALLFASGAFVRVRIESRWAGVGELWGLPWMSVGDGEDARTVTGIDGCHVVTCPCIHLLAVIYVPVVTRCPYSGIGSSLNT
ncbi:HAD-like domain-containing protein [Mycena olivaceomarginata]|nr:HAD-like domain-containing protein [Mycena olivaceomarginata]